jgi:sirohydrochlorin ferrochelatase
MVGRGSNDAEANAEFDSFARLRCERVPVGGLETCFVAMTRPTLDEGLRRAASLPFERVVVQPHLLFPGELLHGIRAAVGAARQRAPDRQWILTKPLGADELLVRALLSRAGLNRVQESDATEPQAICIREPQAICVPSGSAHPILIEGVGPRADLALPEPNV